MGHTASSSPPKRDCKLRVPKTATFAEVFVDKCTHIETKVDEFPRRGGNDEVEDGSMANTFISGL